MTLDEEFTARLWMTCRDAGATGYLPIRFEEMLRTLNSGARIAKKLIASGDIQYGLKELIRRNRDDLAMERIMLEPKFATPLSKRELEAAEWRIAEAKREVALEE